MSPRPERTEGKAPQPRQGVARPSKPARKSGKAPKSKPPPGHHDTLAGTGMEQDPIR
jgi:hypothetical protein